MISIHALREEGDLTKRLKRTDTGISIHALREEGDGELRFALPSYWYFYPRPPRGGRPGLTAWPAVTAMLISIHALREEGDKLTETRLRLNTDFYPRPPRGGRPCGCLCL